MNNGAYPLDDNEGMVELRAQLCGIERAIALFEHHNHNVIAQMAFALQLLHICDGKMGQMSDTNRITALSSLSHPRRATAAASTRGT